MYKYLDEVTVSDFSEAALAAMYERGFVFTRLGKGVMHQINSLRVRLASFELSSENRRVLHKNEDVGVAFFSLPLADYSWQIAKLGQDFYREKFGEGVMSAFKLKEMFTDPLRSNMNGVFVYTNGGERIGYSLAFSTSRIIHYSYPFYDLALSRNLGMAMMLKALLFAEEYGREFLYLGTLQEYKLQFKGAECFKEGKWIIM